MPLIFREVHHCPVDLRASSAVPFRSWWRFPPTQSAWPVWRWFIPLATRTLPSVSVSMAVAVSSAAGMRHRGVKNFWLSSSVRARCRGGHSSRAAFIPRARAGAVVPFFPTGLRDRGLLVEPAPQARYADAFRALVAPSVEGVLLLFGLVNAGVPFHGLEDGMWAIPIAALGRPIGIVAPPAWRSPQGYISRSVSAGGEVVVVGCTATDSSSPCSLRRP